MLCFSPNHRHPKAKFGWLIYKKNPNHPFFPQFYFKRKGVNFPTVLMHGPCLPKKKTEKPDHSVEVKQFTMKYRSN